MSTSELISQWYEEVWNKGNESFIDEMMHKDIIVHGLDPVGTTKGIENFKSFYKNFRSSFPHVHVDAKTLVNDEEFATAWCHVSAKNVNGNTVSFNGLSVARYKEGKLIEGWNSFDFLKMYQQLGHRLVADEEFSDKAHA
jgi:predicted ester cyclase